MNAKAEAKSAARAGSALIFEFDHLAARVREAAFEVLRSIFDGLDVTPMLFSRTCLNATPLKMAEQIQAALGVKKATTKKLAEEISNGIQMHLETGNVQISDALRDVIVQARDLSMQVIAFTALPPHPRDALADRLDLNGLGIELVPFGTALEPSPRADAWLKLCKERGYVAPISVALTTGMQATKAALTAGIPCVAIPDRFTEFQDYGGARLLASSLKEINLSALSHTGPTAG